MRIALRFLVCIPLCFCLYYSLSQKENKNNYAFLLSQYNRANKIYDEATALGNSRNYDEAKERALNQQALNLYQNILQNFSGSSSEFDSIRFYCAFKIGELQHYFEHFQEALHGYSEAISIKQNSRLPDSLLFKPYLYSGIIYYNQNKYDTATLFFKKAEGVQLKYNYSLDESERLFNTFGVLYYEKGDYKQAKNYFLKALSILPKSHPYYKELYINYNINLAQIYFKLEDYDKSNEIYQSLLSIKGIDANDINQNIGLINLNLGAAGEALQYFRKVHYDSSNKSIFLYHNIGEAFFNLEQFDSAKKYLEKAINSSKSFGGNTDYIAYGQTLKSLGDLQLHFNDISKALSYYQQALHQFYPDYSNDSITSNPKKFSGIFSYINLFNTLTAKAEAFHLLYQSSSKFSDAENELKAYQSAFKLIDYVERTYTSDEARLFLDKIKYTVHAKPIDLCYELYQRTKDKKYLEALYNFDQQNKASILTVRTEAIEQNAGQDSSFLQKERAVKSEITRLSLKASQTNDEKTLTEINNEIRDEEIALSKIQDKLTTQGTNKIPTVKFLQQDFLDDATALISFHLSSDKLTTILISQKRFDCWQQKLISNFQEVLEQYIQELKQPVVSSADNSKQLYHFLFSNFNLKDFKRLIIIPDDELNYLSFESLQNDEGEFLIQHCSVQYQFSTALLKKENLDFANHQTLSFAPFADSGFKDSSFSFDALPNSSAEIRDLKGEKFVGAAATKQNFLKNLSEFKVLHLATHAVVNDQQDNLSFISFYPRRHVDADNYLLYSEEIANLPLNTTKLVILSACETGNGSLVKGEGVMSLSRAFAYAGCSNIITSLWNANDFSTAYLTNKLHFYLDKNFSIDEALRQAKLDYLNDKSVNPRMKTPFYWSHLVFVGSYYSAKSFNWFWIILSIVTFVVVITLWFKIKKPH